MTATQIFVLQIFINLLVFGLAARRYVLPLLRRLPFVEALTPLILAHALRTMGLAFLIPGVAGGELPQAFAAPGAYGDLLAVVLALLSVLALRRGWRGAPALVWVFSVLGLLDFVNAYAQGVRFDLIGSYPLGALWFIPTFAVPAFSVLHVLVIVVLVTRGHEYRLARRRERSVHHASLCARLTLDRSPAGNPLHRGWTKG